MPPTASQTSPPGVTLDSPPPQPPGGGRAGRSLMDTQAQSPGLGSAAANPQVMALQGLQMVERGVQLISTTLPALGPQLAEFLNQLRMVTAQGVAGTAGGPQVGAPGAMPMAMPPPGGGMGM